MDRPRGYHEPDKDKYDMLSLIYVKSKKRYKWAYIQNRSKPTDVENKVIVTKGEEGRYKLSIWG